ncbi:MAG: methylisocitrate lyase [Cyanobacteria bacterium P01_H01_bin.74]
MIEKNPVLTPVPNKPTTLRERLSDKKTLVLPGAFNAISAKIIEQEGFEGAYVTGAGIANGVFGYPDIGMVTAVEMATQAGYIAQAVTIPVIADADNGYGEAINVFRTVQLYEQAGLSGLHIEDQVMPKRCGHLEGKQIISITAMAEKIQAASAARVNPDFLLIARVDSKSVHGFEDAVNRAHAYLQAGADMIFIEALTSEAEFEQFASLVKAPLMANMTEFGKTPYIPVSAFESWGYAIVIFPMTIFRIMMKAMQTGLQSLQCHGTQAHLLDTMTSRKDLYRILQYTAYEELDASIATAFSENNRAIDL